MCTITHSILYPSATEQNNTTNLNQNHAKTHNKFKIAPEKHAAVVAQAAKAEAAFASAAKSLKETKAKLAAETKQHAAAKEALVRVKENTRKQLAKVVEKAQDSERRQKAAHAASAAAELAKAIAAEKAAFTKELAEKGPSVLHFFCLLISLLLFLFFCLHLFFCLLSIRTEKDKKQATMNQSAVSRLRVYRKQAQVRARESLPHAKR